MVDATRDLSSCDVCGGPISKDNTGNSSVPPPRYCSNACRQRAYRQRRKSAGVGTVTSGGSLTQLTSFVGRTDEVVELGRLLRTARLLTLTGPAGVGKTRLAVELADREQRSRHCEVVLVELGTMAPDDPDPVQQRILSALGMAVDVPAPRSPSRSENHEQLLVLDNCEHLLDPCSSLLNDILPYHPDLRVLATSRESFRLPGEVVHSMAGLPTPDLGGEPLVTDYLRSDALRLFIDRARAVAPDFQLTEANAPRIGAICAQLDGLPLIIELAARLVRAFPLAEICDRLEDRLSLLTGGWRTADQRHQSWRGALRWSYELLAPVERALFRRLSVLPGGFGPDAVAAVAFDEAVPLPSVAELLVGLETKSLILPSTDRESGSVRFRLLESIRCYGHECLVAEDEEAQTYDRLTAWLTRLASPLCDTAIASETTVRRLADERDNIEHALRWLRDGRDERQLVLAGALVMVELVQRSPRESTRDTITHALDHTDQHSAYRGVALEGAAMLASRDGDQDEALRLMQQAVDINRHGESAQLFSRLLLRLSMLREMGGDQEAAFADLMECLQLSRRIDVALMTSFCLSNLAWHMLTRGELVVASELMDEILPVMRAQAPNRLQGVLNTAGALALERDDLAMAERCFVESLETVTDYPHSAVCSIAGLAITATRNSQFERGLQLIAAAELLGGQGLSNRTWWRERVAAAWATAMKSLPPARAENALAAGRALTARQAVAVAMRSQQQDVVKTTGTDPLSQRERDVIDLVVKGLTNRQIAARMHLSVRTVETHVRNIRVTLGLRSRAHVAAWAAQRKPAIVAPNQALRSTSSA